MAGMNIGRLLLVISHLSFWIPAVAGM